MQIRIPLADIEAAWPNGVYELFISRGVRLEASSATFDPANVRFAEPCAHRWEEAGDLLVEQP
jgi:hypothetical protein